MTLSELKTWSLTDLLEANVALSIKADIDEWLAKPKDT